jgi:hypothetical protein
MPARVETDRQFSHRAVQRPFETDQFSHRAKAYKPLHVSCTSQYGTKVLQDNTIIQQCRRFGLLFCAAHTPIRFGRPMIARTTAISSSVRTSAQPSVPAAPRSAPRRHDLRSTRRLPRPPLGLHDLSSTLAGCRVRAVPLGQLHDLHFFDFNALDYGDIWCRVRVSSPLAPFLHFAEVRKLPSPFVLSASGAVSAEPQSSGASGIQKHSRQLLVSASSLPPSSFLHWELHGRQLLVSDSCWCPTAAGVRQLLVSAKLL